MNASTSRQGRVSVILLQGPMIGPELHALDRELTQCAGDGQVRIVLDLRQVPFIDSAGLERIQSAVSDFGKRGGDLRVFGLNQVCRDIFLCTRMESFVQAFQDRDRAVSSLL